MKGSKWGGNVGDWNRSTVVARQNREAEYLITRMATSQVPASPMSVGFVPNVVGTELTAAQAALVLSGLQSGTVTDTGGGRVISQDPAPKAMVSLGTAVNLTV